MRVRFPQILVLLTAVAAAATAACSGSQTPAQAAADRGGAGPPAVPVATAIVEQKPMPVGPQRHRHGRGVLERRRPLADHRLADVGQFQGRRRRHQGPGAVHAGPAAARGGAAAGGGDASARHGAGGPGQIHRRALRRICRAAGSRRKEQADQSRTAAAALEATLAVRPRRRREREGPAAVRHDRGADFRAAPAR